jgi:hypothetical protein
MGKERRLVNLKPLRLPSLLVRLQLIVLLDLEHCPKHYYFFFHPNADFSDSWDSRLDSA